MSDPTRLRTDEAEAGRDVPEDLLDILRQRQYGVGRDHYRKAKAVIEKITSPIITSLQKRDLVCRPEYVGSSFEGTKTSVSDFDILIILNGSELTVEEITPQFSLLRQRRLDNRTFIVPNEFLTSDGLVDPSKVRSKLQSWIKREINEHPDVGDQADFIVPMGPSGPAITLTIIPNSSSLYQSIGKISVDLVPAFQVSDLYFVAKPCKQVHSGQLSAAIPNKNMLWRKSFSLREKNELKRIDRHNGCRRECVKILKCLRQRDPPLKYLASYHYKVLVLNECKRYPKSEYWTPRRLADRLWDALESLEDYLDDKRLPHVFDPRTNTFDTVSDETALTNTLHRVRRLLNKGSAVIKAILEREYEALYYYWFQSSLDDLHTEGLDLQLTVEEESSDPWKVVGGAALDLLSAIAEPQSRRDNIQSDELGLQQSEKEESSDPWKVLGGAALDLLSAIAEPQSRRDNIQSDELGLQQTEKEESSDPWKVVGSAALDLLSAIAEPQSRRDNIQSDELGLQQPEKEESSDPWKVLGGAALDLLSAFAEPQPRRDNIQSDELGLQQSEKEESSDPWHVIGGAVFEGLIDAVAGGAFSSANRTKTD